MMVSAYAVKESLVLGQVMTENKGGELAAAQELIARLGLQGKLRAVQFYSKPLYCCSLEGLMALAKSA